MSGVADAGDGARVLVDDDLLRPGGGDAGGVGAAQVVGLGGVIPEGLDGRVAVVGALRHRGGVSLHLGAWETEGDGMQVALVCVGSGSKRRWLSGNRPRCGRSGRCRRR